jgi:uncharacterized membrane protein YbhN (UPF0104 family)
MSVARAAGRRRDLAPWLLSAVAVYIGLTWWFGGADTLQAASRIGLAPVLGGLALTSANFAVRGLRWHFLLRRLGCHVPLRVDAAVYLAGIGLSATPGKVGETVRSALLVRHGVPVASSLAAFLADRLSDLLAVLLIALVPVALAYGWSGAAALRWLGLLLAAAIAPLLLIALLRTPRGAARFARLAQLRWLRRPTGWALGAAADFARLWRPGTALPSIAASLLAYGLQACILAQMVDQVMPTVGWVACFGIFGAATLAGAASFIPGGVGAMELALVLLLRAQGVDAASALAVALCLRAVTFWFGLLLGAAGLSVAARLQRTAAG